METPHPDDQVHQPNRNRPVTLQTLFQELQAQRAVLAKLLNPGAPPPDYLPRPAAAPAMPLTPDTPVPVLTAPPTGEQPTHAPGKRETAPRFAYEGICAQPRSHLSPKAHMTVLEIPLALHPTPNETIWRYIIFYGERADKLKDKDLKGKRVTVIGGAEKQVLKRRKDGSERMRTEVNGYALKVQEPHTPSSA